MVIETMSPEDIAQFIVEDLAESVRLGDISTHPDDWQRAFARRQADYEHANKVIKRINEAAALREFVESRDEQ